MENTASRAKDELLALRCQLGEPAAFKDLVGEMERPLLYYTIKLLKDEDRAFDVLQEVWITAFRGISKIDDPKSLRAWLYRITHGLSIDRIRKDSSWQRTEQAVMDSFQDVEEPVSLETTDANALHRALDQIEVKHREVLVLHFLEDFSITEIASVVGCPEGTVKSRIHHAKKALKEVLVRGGYDGE
jgi:RNA polymerase sigma-70 factor (ECF subfamily)